MADNNISLLVGAGFSKELFSQFPSMQELTLDVQNDVDIQSLLKQIDIPLPLFGRTSPNAVNIEDWIRILEDSGAYFKDSLVHERRKYLVKLMMRRISENIRVMSSQIVFTEEQLDLIEILLKSRINILTTNYDLIFERAIQELKSQNRIDINTPYDLNVGRIELAYKRKRETYLSAGQSDTSPFSRIHKLHGSCDWFSPGIDESEEIFVDISLIEGFLDSDLRVLSREICESMSPLFAGPSSVKSSQINSKALKPVWTSAYSALRGTSIMFVYGSSLHESDSTLNGLIMEGLSTGGRIHIFDLEPNEIIKRASKLTTDPNNRAQPVEKVSFKDLVETIEMYKMR